MKRALAIAAVAATIITSFHTSAKANEHWIGPILGGVAGGFVGNKFGNGTGKTIATAVGAVGGLLLGQSINKNQQIQQPMPQYRQPNPIIGSFACEEFRNYSERSQCNRGVADRLAAYQRSLERNAYNFGRGQGYNNSWVNTVMPYRSVTW